MDQSMQMVLSAVQQYCWTANIAGILLMLITRLFTHSRRGWGLTGVVLLTIASIKPSGARASAEGLSPSFSIPCP